MTRNLNVDYFSPMKISGMLVSKGIILRNMVGRSTMEGLLGFRRSATFRIISS
jgi:hypothetical protein